MRNLKAPRFLQDRYEEYREKKAQHLEFIKTLADILSGVLIPLPASFMTWIALHGSIERIEQEGLKVLPDAEFKAKDGYNLLTHENYRAGDPACQFR